MQLDPWALAEIDRCKQFAIFHSAIQQMLSVISNRWLLFFAKTIGEEGRFEHAQAVATLDNFA